MPTLISASGTTLPATLDAPDSPWQQMLRWQRDGAALCFVYARSLGGLMQTGRGQLARLSPEALTLDADPCKLMVMLTGAAFETGPQLFFTPDLLSRFDVDGIAVRLANHDWLFLTASALPAHIAIAGG